MTRERVRSQQTTRPPKGSRLLRGSVLAVSPLTVQIAGGGAVGGVPVPGAVYKVGDQVLVLAQEPAVGPVYPLTPAPPPDLTQYAKTSDLSAYAKTSDVNPMCILSYSGSQDIGLNSYQWTLIPWYDVPINTAGVTGNNQPNFQLSVAGWYRISYRFALTNAYAAGANNDNQIRGSIRNDTQATDYFNTFGTGMVADQLYSFSTVLHANANDNFRISVYNAGAGGQWIRRGQSPYQGTAPQFVIERLSRG